MKSITVYFEDKDQEKLLKIKGDKTWRQLIMDLVKENGAKP